jgi:hypothetical protein
MRKIIIFLTLVIVTQNVVADKSMPGTGGTGSELGKAFIANDKTMDQKFNNIDAGFKRIDSINKNIDKYLKVLSCDDLSSYKIDISNMEKSKLNEDENKKLATFKKNIENYEKSLQKNSIHCE